MSLRAGAPVKVTATSTASSRRSTSTRACWRCGASDTPLLERASSSPSSPATWTSSSRSGSPAQAAGLGRHPYPLLRRAHAAGTALGDLRQGRTARRAPRADLRRGGAARASTRRASGCCDGPSSRRTAGRAEQLFRRDLPGPDSPGGGLRAPVPVHLEPVPQPRGAGARPGRGRCTCARQGAAAAAPLRRVLRGPLLRAPRGGDRGQLDQLFPGMEIVEHHTFRSPATRTSRSTTAPTTCWRRSRSSCDAAPGRRAARGRADNPQHVLELLMSELEVGDDDVYLCRRRSTSPGSGASTPSTAGAQGRAYVPVTHPDLSLADEDMAIFEVVARPRRARPPSVRSFTTSVQRFIEEAAADPTCSRSSRRSTHGGQPDRDALIEAAERGKQVVVLVELKARFDESANIAWARTLEKAGCHVVYGVAGLRALPAVPRRARRRGTAGAVRARRHGQLRPDHGTPLRGHRDSSRPTLPSAPRSRHLFNYITGFSRHKEYESLIVAPHGMRTRIVSMIEREARLSTPEHPRPHRHEAQQPLPRGT